MTLHNKTIDQEPNPFEQSFSSISPKTKFNTFPSPPKLNKGVDTWVTDISSYTFDSNSSITNGKVKYQSKLFKLKTREKGHVLNLNF